MEKCCEQCGKLFQTNYKQQKFCSAKCRDKSRSLKNHSDTKTDWEKIVQKSMETGLSYGKMVQNGII